MENIEELLGTLQDQSFTFNYENREVRIDLVTLLSDYNDGTSFIDYISDFYYVQSVYQKLKNNEDADPVEFFKEFSNSNKSYYKLLSFIKFYYSELISCLKLIQSDLGNKDNSFVFIVELVEKRKPKYLRFSISSQNLEHYTYIKIKNDHGDKNKILTDLITQLYKSSNPYVKLFFLEAISELIINDKLYVFHDSDTFFYNLETIFSNIRDLTKKFNNAISNRISSGMFCLVSKETNDWFGKMIKNIELSNTLNTLTGKNRRNLNCYAVAYSDKFSYYAINNLDGDDQQKLHDLFTKLLNNIPAAKLTNDVRYYLTDEENSITYDQFKNHIESIESSYNRMFTCCERKILAKLREEELKNNKINKINKMNILVTQAPCVYCSRELNYIKKKGSVTININYPELRNINYHDCLAQKIFNLNNPEE